MAGGKSALTVAQVLTWADAHHARTGRWPRATEPGPSSLPPGEIWRNIDTALRQGHRGLPGGDSLRRLLARRRGVRRPLTVRGVLRWADEHYRRAGRWPSSATGPVVGAPGETWAAIRMALRHGLRGLPGGDSLSALLRRSGRVPRRGRPPNTPATPGAAGPRRASP
jgi:hypothetical protein